MLISDLLKNQATISAGIHQTVLEVARLMVDHNIGAVPVLRQGELIGIFSERDLMNRVVVKGKDPARTAVRDVMTEDPLTVAPSDNLGNLYDPYAAPRVSPSPRLQRAAIARRRLPARHPSPRPERERR